MDPKKPSSIRVLRLASDDSLVRDFALATGGQGNRHAAMASLGREVYNLIAPMFPLEPGSTRAEETIQWVALHDASDDYMTFTIEIYGPHPGGDHPATIIENAIRGHIEARVARSGSRKNFERMKVIVHIL